MGWFQNNVKIFVFSISFSFKFEVWALQSFPPGKSWGSLADSPTGSRRYSGLLRSPVDPALGRGREERRKNFQPPTRSALMFCFLKLNDFCKRIILTKFLLVIQFLYQIIGNTVLGKLKEGTLYFLLKLEENRCLSIHKKNECI